MIASKQEILGADVAGHYDELDAFYREIWGQDVHHGLWLTGRESQAQAVRQLTDVVADEARVTPGSRVVDIGCGYGATARVLAADYGATVTGITISPAQYAVATAGASENGGNPSFLLGDWLTCELPSSSFTAAVAIESSEHMPDKAGFFAQAHRVLEPGGRLVICAWLAAEKPSEPQQRWLLEPICREGRMPHLGSESDYRAMAAASGFTAERVQDVTKAIARTWPMIAGIFLLNLARKPSYLRFLLDRYAKNRIFAWTIFRLWIAFRTGAMRYCIFTLRKAESAV